MSWLSRNVKAAGKKTRRGVGQFIWNQGKKMMHETLQDREKAMSDVDEHLEPLGGRPPEYEIVVKNDATVSAKKTASDTGENIVAVAAGAVAAWISQAVGFDISPELVLSIGAVLVKAALKFYRDFTKRRVVEPTETL